MSLVEQKTVTTMAPKNHLLLSKSGIALASWIQIFPYGQSIALDEIHIRARSAEAQIDGAIEADKILWLRLYASEVEDSEGENANGASIATQIANVRQHFPTQALIVMSDIPHDLEALAVFTKGARGYCNAHAGEEVVSQIAAVVEQGGLWIGESIMQLLIAKSATSALSPRSQISEANWQANWRTKLTERETQVAHAIAKGASNREIATQLGITERTVKAHVGAILEKCGVRDRLQLGLLVRT